MANIPRPVYVEGVRFESVEDACILAENPRTGRQGITRQLVNRSIRAGRPGWYYEDCGQEEPPADRKPKGKPGRPVVIARKQYANLAVAREAIGGTRHALVRRILNGEPGCYYVDEGQRPDIRPAAAPVAKVARPRGRKPNPFTLDGVQYQSLAAASAALGKSIGFVRNARAREMASEDAHAAADRRGKPIIVNGIRYDSMSAAARALQAQGFRGGLSAISKRVKQIQAARAGRTA